MWVWLYRRGRVAGCGMGVTETSVGANKWSYDSSNFTQENLPGTGSEPSH